MWRSAEGVEEKAVDCQEAEVVDAQDGPKVDQEMEPPAESSDEEMLDLDDPKQVRAHILKMVTPKHFQKAIGEPFKQKHAEYIAMTFVKWSKDAKKQSKQKNVHLSTVVGSLFPKANCGNDIREFLRKVWAIGNRRFIRVKVEKDAKKNKTILVKKEHGKI